MLRDEYAAFKRGCVGVPGSSAERGRGHGQQGTPPLHRLLNLLCRRQSLFRCAHAAADLGQSRALLDFGSAIPFFPTAIPATAATGPGSLQGRSMLTVDLLRRSLSRLTLLLLLHRQLRLVLGRSVLLVFVCHRTSPWFLVQVHRHRWAGKPDKVLRPRVVVMRVDGDSRLLTPDLLRAPAPRSQFLHQELPNVRIFLWRMPRKLHVAGGSSFLGQLLRIGSPESRPVRWASTRVSRFRHRTSLTAGVTWRRLRRSPLDPPVLVPDSEHSPMVGGSTSPFFPLGE